MLLLLAVTPSTTLCTHYTTSIQSFVPSSIIRTLAIYIYIYYKQKHHNHHQWNGVFTLSIWLFHSNFFVWHYIMIICFQNLKSATLFFSRCCCLLLLSWLLRLLLLLLMMVVVVVVKLVVLTYRICYLCLCWLLSCKLSNTLSFPSHSPSIKLYTWNVLVVLLLFVVVVVNFYFSSTI